MGQNSRTIVLPQDNNMRPGTNVFSLSVATNQMLQLTSLGGGIWNGLPGGLPGGPPGSGGPVGGVTATFNGNTYTSSWLFNDKCTLPWSFQGPGTLTLAFVNGAGDANFSYRYLDSTGPVTVIADTNVIGSGNISVPIGKRIHFLTLPHDHVGLTLMSTNGTQSYFHYNPLNFNNFSQDQPMGIFLQELEFTGPITITLSDKIESSLSVSYRNYSGWITYYLTDDVIQVPAGVQAPAGSVLMIEKSTDLKTWNPAFFLQNSTDPKAYYRFKVAQ